MQDGPQCTTVHFSNKLLFLYFSGPACKEFLSSFYFFPFVEPKCTTVPNLSHFDVLIFSVHT